MTPEGFKAWREQLGLSKQLAAKLLGVPTESIDRYECKLRLNGNWLVQIPNTVERSCKYLARQRQIYWQLQMLESGTMLEREVPRASVLKNRQELTQKLAGFSTQMNFFARDRTSEVTDEIKALHASP